jgi:hypothetical protein
MAPPDIAEPTFGFVVVDEGAKYRHAHVKGDGERDMVENAKPWGEQSNMAFR